MAPRVVAAAGRVLYRVARGPAPATFPPLRFQGKGRFDDSRGEYRVLYAAAQRRGAFVETMASFRPDLAYIARAPRVSAADLATLAALGEIPAEYFHKQICRIRVGAGQRWLDLRSPRTHQWLRLQLAPELVEAGIASAFDWADLLSSDLALTQIVGRFAFARAFQGVVYPSSHDPSLDCWVIFEGAEYRQVGKPLALSPLDQDLVAVMELFGLRLPDAITGHEPG